MATSRHARRLGEWVLASSGSVLCFWIALTVLDQQARSAYHGKPYGWIVRGSLWDSLHSIVGLIYFALLALLGGAGVVLDHELSALVWGRLTWLACGALLCIVVTTLGQSLFPFLLLPLVLWSWAAWLADRRRHRAGRAAWLWLAVGAASHWGVTFVLGSVLQAWGW